MPLVSISTTTLKRLIGKSLGRDELVQALEQLGNNVEGVASVTSWRCERCGQLTDVLEHADFNQACEWCGSKAITEAGSSEVIRISLLPVRPDMFDAAGLARALRGYLGIETGLPEYRLEPSGFSVRVQPGLENIRPHIVACVVRGLVMDDETVKTIMKMQENLHWALGRDRRRASIGVYDLDTVEPDFEYSAVAPDGVKFVPLFGMPEGRITVTPQDVIDKHPKGMAYRHLLEGMPAYPLLSDAGGKVLSMPPIINSEETKVTSRTHNLFVDVTGPDKNAIVRTIAVIATGLADLGAKVETVSVRYPDGTKETTPDLRPQAVSINPADAERLVGSPVPGMANVLERMRYGCRAEGDRLAIEIPAYRADIMHEYDVFEDVAIGFGYHNIRPQLVPSMTVGSHQPVEELSVTVRRVMTGLGFLETMTLALTSEQEHFDLLGLKRPEHYVRLENPISVEQTMARSHLLTGLLSTFRVNSTHEMPQHLFEVGDCYEFDDAAETGVRTRRKLGAGMAGPRVGFADIRAVADAVARELGLNVEFRPAEHPALIRGRAATLRREELVLGTLGEVHPEVLERFDIAQPVAMLEVDLSDLP